MPDLLEAEDRKHRSWCPYGRMFVEKMWRPVLPYNKQQHYYFFLHRRRRPSRKNKQTLDAVFMLKPRYNYLQKKRGGQEEEEEVVIVFNVIV